MNPSVFKNHKKYNEFLFKPDEIRPRNLLLGVEPYSPIMEYCVLLGALKGDTFIASGTGTFIAPYLIITAKHVIEDYWDKFNNTPLKKNSTSNFQIIAAQFVKGRPIVAWISVCTQFNASTDIAYLQVVPYINANNYIFHTFPTIQFSPPTIGSQIICFGYSKTTGKVKNIIKVRASPSISKGTVLDIHRERRDNYNLFFPCIHTNAVIEGGMSGGPVFDENGHLCAVNTTGINFNSYNEEPISYVSLLWASVGIKFNIGFKDKNPINSKRECYIFDLCKSNYINSLNYNNIVMYPNGGYISFGNSGLFFRLLIFFNIKENYYNELLLLKRFYRFKKLEIKIGNIHAIYILYRLLKNKLIHKKSFLIENKFKLLNNAK